jgi:hypothetical protein
MRLLRKIDDAILRRARGDHQRRQLAQRFDRDHHWTDRERRTGHAIRHPDRNRRGALIVGVEPHLAAMPHAPLHQNRSAMQRMPGIVNGDVLSVMGGM